MITARTDPFRTVIPDDPEREVERTAYAWYDPDAADFDATNPLADLDPPDDEELAAALGRG